MCMHIKVTKHQDMSHNSARNNSTIHCAGCCHVSPYSWCYVVGALPELQTKGNFTKSFGRMGKGRFETPRSAWQSSKVCQKPEGSTSVKEQSPVGQNQVLMSKSQALLGKTKC